MPARSCLVALLALLTLAAGPSTQPAAPWLDRAAAAYATALDQKPAEPLTILRDIDLGVWLVTLRGTDADRALLRRALGQPPVRAKKESDEMWTLHQVLHGVDGLIALGDIAAARGRLNQGKVLAETMKTGGFPDPKALAAVGYAAYYAALGDYDEAVAWNDRGILPSYEYLALLFHRYSQPALRDRAFAEALKIARGEPDRASAAMAQAECGLIDAAIETAGTIKTDYILTSRLRNTVEKLNASGREADAKELVAGVLPIFLGLEDPMADTLSEMAGTCIEVGDVKHAHLLIERAAASFAEQEDPGWYPWPKLAIRAASIGDDKLARQYLASSDKIVAKLDDAKTQAQAEVYHAAALAYLGDFAAANDRIRKSIALDRPDYSVSEVLSSYTEALAQKGRADDAVALVKELIPEPNDRDFYLRGVAIIEATAGRFEHAWDLTLTLAKYPHVALGAQRRISRMALDAGRLDGLLPRIERLPNPRARMMVYVAIAERLTGRSAPFASMFDGY